MGCVEFYHVLAALKDWLFQSMVAVSVYPLSGRMTIFECNKRENFFCVSYRNFLRSLNIAAGHSAY